ncbi:hypothetical protein NL108_015761, partial [Boleophthalmus pectinirostris]
PQQRYIHSGYNTISSSKSSGDMKFSTLARGEGLGGVGGLGTLSVSDQDYVKGGSWSALTMGQPPRQLLQQGAHTLDRSMLKSKSCQQDLSTNYLQVGRRHDWSSSLGRAGVMGRGVAMEIPCRRMRSGSYVKAMGDIADSDDSDLSPKPSPKSAARRQSYLRATQQSLSDQLPPRNCLPSLQELSSNPPLDQMHSLGGERLDSLGGTVSSGWDDDDLREAVSSLARRSGMGQLRGMDSGPYEDHSSEFSFRDAQDSPPDLPSDFPPHLPPDLPRPSCFRSRSHSYLRAIQAGCSQDEDSLSLESTSPPPTESSVRTYSTSTDDLSAQWTQWKYQFGSYLRATGLDKAPKEKQLAACGWIICFSPFSLFLSLSTVSTCVSTCKRTAPPPVPPRTTSKPYISVTVQSSTESAQDTYLEREEGRREEGLRSEVTSQSSQAHSNSSDSLDSTHANSLARSIRRPPQITAVARETRDTREAIVPNKSHAATETTDCDTKGAKANMTLTGAAKTNTTLTPDDPQEAPAPRRKLSSIGIQVDCVQESSDPVPREDTPPLSRFQSIGVQVEDGWQSRSSSMTKQDTDSDTQEVPLPLYKPQSKPSEKKVMVSCGSQSVAQDSLDQEVPTPSTPPITRQILNRSTTRSSSDSFSESLDPTLDPTLDPSLDSGLDPALDPSCLPPPDPWLESGVSGGGGAAVSGGNLCRRDGQWFLKLLEAERGRMEGWCEQMEQETQHHQLSEEVLGKVQSAVSSAQLLMSQKFFQILLKFLNKTDPLLSPRPSPQDLAGFWDLLQVSIEDLSLKFDELYHLKSNEWQPLERKERATATLKKPVKVRSSLGREQSSDPPSSSRQEARKRLVAAKKSTSFRQNSATESADSLEMYVPEAQTRL